MKVSEVAPCQCSSPGGQITVSPGPDADHLTGAGTDEADALAYMEGLAHVVGVPVRTGAWGEAHQGHGHP
jgi:hypothetical protein